MADEETVKEPKSKAEMRHEPHGFEDDTTGWCAACGRSEEWKAHTVSVVAGPSTVATVPPKKKK